MRRRAAFIFLTLVALTPAPALGQAYPREDFSAHQFYIQPGPGNFVLVDGGTTGPDMLPTFGATLGYAHRPFAADDLNWYIDCARGLRTPDECRTIPSPTDETDLLGSLLTLQLYGSFAFLDRIQIGLNLPVFLFAEGSQFNYVEDNGGMVTTRQAAPGGVVGGLGDPRISAKIRILDPDARGNGIVLAAAAFVNLPLGHYIAPGHFIGDRAPSLGAYLVGGLQYDGFRVALNLGGTFREEQANIRSVVGSSLNWGVAAAYRVHPIVDVQLEATGWTSFGQYFDSEAPTEIRAQGVLTLGEVSIHLGIGAGLVYGVGLPVMHVFGGASFTPNPDPDADADGVHDSQDGCPAEAEDEDGYEDEDGCPEDDNDEDGIADADDRCADEPEDVDEHEDEDGCPDADNDGDGVRDGYDSCPTEAEDMDGDRDTDGCPDTDPDQDGIDGEADECPSEAEDFDGLGDSDGCPETDFDRDNISDETDQCPEEAEDRNGRRDRDGCPDGERRRRGADAEE